MDFEFKQKLLSLYSFYDRVTGPYLRNDGRKHICLNNTSLSKGDPNKTKTLSWPKAIMEVKLGRLLDLNETVDHIDENLSNDAIENLQILTRSANILKSFKLNPERYEQFTAYKCPECGVEFLALDRQVRGNQLKQNKSGPFCSRKCSGKHNQRVGHLAQLAEASDLSSEK